MKGCNVRVGHIFEFDLKRRDNNVAMLFPLYLAAEEIHNTPLLRGNLVGE